MIFSHVRTMCISPCEYNASKKCSYFHRLNTMHLCIFSLRVQCTCVFSACEYNALVYFQRVSTMHLCIFSVRGQWTCVFSAGEYNAHKQCLEKLKDECSKKNRRSMLERLPGMRRGNTHTNPAASECPYLANTVFYYYSFKKIALKTTP